MAKRRPSGDGMVRKRDDGRWEGRIVVGHKDNGDSIFRYVYANTQKELTAKLRKSITAYQGVDLTEQSRMTLSEWMDQWLESKAGTIRPKTLANHRGYIKNHIEPALGYKQISLLKAADIRKFYTKISGELASCTVRCIHTTLHGILDAAVQARLIPSNPTEEVGAPKFTCKPKQVLTDEQLDTFMETIKGDAVWHDFFYTELTTGLRRGELCALRWEDFEEEHGTLHVRHTLHKEKGKPLTTGDTKTYAGTRKIVLPPSTAQLLRERKKTALTEWIFPNPVKPEQPTDPGAAYNRLKVLLKQAGLPDIRFHDLRHTFATNALKHGMDVKTLSTIIGHISSRTTLNVYAHVTDEMKEKAAVTIDRGIGKAEPQETPQAPPAKTMTEFQPAQRSRRRPGTGYIKQIHEHRWSGRCTMTWPDGSTRIRTISGKTEEECEEKLAALIAEMKAERARLKEEGMAS